MNSSDLGSSNYWLYICQPAGRECHGPEGPSLDGDATSDNLQSQSILIKATKPQDFDADVVIWEVSKIVNNTPVKEYEFASRDGVPAGLPAATVRFGAPGLDQDSQYAFRVSYCQESSPGTIDKCTCRSGYSAWYSTSSLDGAAPASPLVQQVEDQFRRRNTGKTIEGGDGIGPPEVWLEISTSGNARQTIVDNERVVARHSAPIVYVASTAATGHTYSEVLYKRDPGYTGAYYNVDALARVFFVTGSNTLKGYAVKLVTEPSHLALAGSGAELQIRRFAGTSNSPALNPVKVANLSGTNCGATIPLGTNGSTEPVWVRIEVAGSGSEDPSIFGEVAWGGCTETGALTSCSSHCSYSGFWTDTGDPGEMTGSHGQWGYFTHHRDYRVEAFRAGSANSGQ